MLRDKFAMAAMQGLVSRWGIRCYELDVSAKAYQIADAMMKERANWDFSGDPDNHHGYKDGYGWLEEREPESAPAEEWQPDWSQAPSGTTGWSMIYDGTAIWHFHHGTGIISAPSFGYQGDWRESLRRRPTE